MNTLATSHLFYTHGYQALIIIAIIFTLIGLFVGWLAWRNSCYLADRAERMNEKLKEKCELLKDRRK